jgi:hypothetical protein
MDHLLWIFRLDDRAYCKVNLFVIQENSHPLAVPYDKIKNFTVLYPARRVQLWFLWACSMNDELVIIAKRVR